MTALTVGPAPPIYSSAHPYSINRAFTTDDHLFFVYANKTQHIKGEDTECELFKFLLKKTELLFTRK